MDDIDSIGEVFLDDEELINDIMKSHKTLTDNQKQQVNNYIDLLNVQDKIEEIKKKEIWQKLQKRKNI